jgi:hypothetical protein
VIAEVIPEAPGHVLLHVPVKMKVVLPAVISQPPTKTAVSRLMPSTHVPLREFKSFNK